jgi:hypothetical protein
MPDLMESAIIEAYDTPLLPPNFAAEWLTQEQFPREQFGPLLWTLGHLGTTHSLTHGVTEVTDMAKTK